MDLQPLSEREFQQAKQQYEQQQEAIVREKPRPSWAWLAPYLLGLLAVMSVVAGINLHGYTYDEPIYAGFGARSAEWVLDAPFALFDGSFSQHFSAAAIAQAWYARINMQPPLVQVLSGISNAFFKNSFGGLIPPRLPNALFFGIAVGALFWLVELIYNKKAAYCAAFALLLLPRFFHDAHLVTLDVPVAALVLLTAAFYYEAARAQSWHSAILSGVVLGLGGLTKLNAVFIAIILLAWSVVFYREMLLKGVVAFCVVAPLVFFIGWPWLWHDTFAHLHEYLQFHLRHYEVLTYYLGKSYNLAPWHYPFVMTAVTTPVVTLVLALLGMGEAVLRRSAHTGKWLLVMCAVGFLLPSALPHVPKYNGVRLFLPAFPFLMALAGGGFFWLTSWLSNRLERVASLQQITNLRMKIALLVGIGFLLPALIGIVKIRPNELAYYNVLAGGPAGAQQKGFETIYWGGVYLQALPILRDLQPGAHVLITPQGAISLLEAYQNGNALQKEITWLAPPIPALQKGNWPQHIVKDADLVLFQCAQAEFDALSWKLYHEGHPLPGSVYYEGVPLLLMYSGDEARRVFGR